MTDLESVAEALKLCGNLVACHSRDWSEQSSDALLWGVLCGWEGEEDHVHDDLCGGSGALDQVADRFQWTPERIDQVKRLRAAVAAFVERPRKALLDELTLNSIDAGTYDLPAPSPGRTTDELRG